jgi:hypothetical protein
MRPKVFGIGLSKTGTSSLAAALNALGVRTIHYPNDPVTYSELRHGNVDLSILKEYSGIADTPVVPYYAQFDKVFPGSKFILTIRDKTSWLASVEKHWQAATNYPDEPLKREFQQFIRAAVYGCIDFNRDRFSYVYDLHFNNVLSYFAHRPDDLLILNICNGEGWERLCSFLGVPVPDIEFPHANEWMTKLIHATEAVHQLPTASKLIVIDDHLLGPDFLQGRQYIPLTERDGVYHGSPANDAAALRELEKTISSYKPTHVVIAWPSFWWLEQYPSITGFLQTRGEQIASSDALITYKLH